MNTTTPGLPATPPPPTYDVIIAGAGPVGLFLACELALADCTVLVLEQAAEPTSPLKQMPFGLRGLNAPSVEALHRRGLLAELQLHKHFNLFPTAPAGSPAARARPAGHFAGLQFKADRIEPAQWPYRLPESTATLLMSELQELETVLSRRAEALGVEIGRGQALTGLQATAEAVVVQAGSRTVQGRWLVGCDGSRGPVRKLAGFEVVGTEPEFTGYSVQVELADPSPLLPGRTMTATGMYWQSQPGYLIMQEFDGGAFHRSGQPLTPAYVQALIRRISGTDVTVRALHVGTVWTDCARQVTAYRRGRVLLAGDAAHIHSPLGGQGLNLGLGDALNLGWKLAATLRGAAPEGLLDTYCTERHPVGARVLDWSRAQVAVMQPTPQGRALRGIIADLLDTPDGATYFAGRVWGLATRYDLGGHHPLIGASVPNFAFADGSTLGERMHAGRGLLLDFGGGHAALQAVASAYGSHLQYLAEPPTEPLGLRALLVRPDGIVAWVATEAAFDEPALRQAVARWFARP